MQPVSPQVIHLQLPSTANINAGSGGVGNVVKNLFSLELAKNASASNPTETSNANPHTTNGGIRAGVFMPASTGAISFSSSSQNMNGKSKNKKTARKTPATQPKK